MVSTDVVQKAGLPAGEYQIVAWDLDTTGRRLIDEFCHIAGYTPQLQFSQYVMPYKDLDLISKRRHLMRTVTIGKYRMLKDLKTGKFLKTKSEISALMDFLTWLEKVKGESGPGVILLAYETFKLAPSLLLEALKKYQLLDRFREVVKGFGDCYAFVKQKCDTTLTSFSLKVVSKVLLDKEDEITSATERARLAYEVVQHLTAGETGGEGDAAGFKVMVDAIREHSSTIDEELQVIDAMKVVLKRQNTLRPVFAPIMRLGIQERKSANVLRRLLTAAFLDYDTLKALWDEGREKLAETVTNKLSDATEEQKNEIVKLLSDHFDPDVPKPELEKKNRYYKKNQRRGEVKDLAASSDIPTTPDSTESNTTTSSPSKSNGVVTPQVESPKHEAEVKVEIKQESEVSVSQVLPQVAQEVDINKVSIKQETSAKVSKLGEVKASPAKNLSPQNKPEVKASPQQKTEAKVLQKPESQTKVPMSKKEAEVKVSSLRQESGIKGVPKVSPPKVSPSKVSPPKQESGVKAAPPKSSQPLKQVSPTKPESEVKAASELKVKAGPKDN